MTSPYETDIITINGLNAALGPLSKSLNIRLCGTVTSTNTLLKAAARENAPEGTVIIADSQTGGRGRLGRSFCSPPGSGLYMSILLRPDLVPGKAVLITAAAAAAVAEATEALSGVTVGIKWVNDIFYDDKKLCGILTEGGISPDGSTLSYAVLGIGLNIYEPPCGFPPEIAELACALYSAPRPGFKIKLAAEILKRFFGFYRKLTEKEFLEIYRSRSLVIGKRVRVISGGGEYSAFALGIDDDCALTVKTDDGLLHRLNSGEISLRIE